MSELRGKELFDAVSDQIEKYQKLLGQLDDFTRRLRESPNEAERELGEILARFAPSIKPNQEWLNATVGPLQVRYSTQRGVDSQRVNVQAVVPSVYEEILYLETFKKSQVIGFLPKSDEANVVYGLAIRGQKTIRHSNSQQAIQGSESLREKINSHILV